MSRSPKSTTSALVVLTGLTAVQIRELLDGKKVAAKAVIAFLREKEATRGLRYPARKLLEELTGEKPVAKATEPKPVAKATEPKPVAKADDLAALVAAIALLTEKVAALEGEKVETKPTPAPAKAAKAAKPVAPKPEPVAAKPVAPKPEPVKAKPAPAPVEDDAITEAEAREQFAALKVAQLRDIADFDTDGMSKAEIVEEMIAQMYDEGVIVAAVPAKAAKAGKPDLKVVAREVAAEVEF